MATTRDIAEPGPLMAGKKGLVMGVANDRSIAWGIARVLHGQGADLAFSYQGGAFGRRAVPLAKGIGAKVIVEADVEDLKSVERVFEEIRKQWGSLDFVVHALAFSDRNELRGRYADTTRKNFEHTMVISCFSFTEVSKLAAELMPSGGSLLDDSVVLWTNDLSNGPPHSYSNVPQILAGGAGGFLKTGQYIDAGNVTHNKFLNTIINAVGIRKDDGTLYDSFGDPSLAKGVINAMIA